MRLGVPDWAIPEEGSWAKESDECRHNNDPESHSRGLCHMTKAQLRALAEENDVAGAKPTMRKEELIELLEEAGL